MKNYDPSKYLDYNELSELLINLEKEWPDFFQLEIIGKSRKDRNVWLVTVTDPSTGAHDNKPAYWVSANIHAAELVGCQAAVHTLYRLYKGLKEDDSRIINLLRNNTFYFVPRISPDGAEAVLQGEWHRSVDLPYPDPENPGWIAKDMDGDGVIRRFLVEDRAGNWKKSKRDSRILLLRAPNENDPEETYYRQVMEGDREGNSRSEHLFMRHSSGLDYNRNFPANWKPEGQQLGAGEYPLSSPETRAIMEAISQRKNIVGAQDFHSHSRVILRPGISQSDEDMNQSDLFVFKALGEMGEAATGYPCLSIKQDFAYSSKQSISGGFLDYLYESRGVFAFTNEIWSMYKVAGIEIEKSKHIEFYISQLSEEDQLKILEWFDQNGEGEWFKAWQSFNHPELGEVEVGGFDYNFTLWNPPSGFLQKEVEGNAEFVICCAEANPKLEVTKFGLVHLGEDTFKLHLEIKNTGFISTGGASTEHSSKITPEAFVELKLDSGFDIITGELYQKVKPLQGRSRIAPYSSNLFATLNEQPSNIDTFEWVIKGQGELTVLANYYRGGKVTRSLKV